MQLLEEKEKTQKEQKKRGVENQIQKAKKEREAHAKQLEVCCRFSALIRMAQW